MVTKAVVKKKPKPKLYISTVPGNESTRPLEVKRLSKEQSEMKKTSTKLKADINSLQKEIDKKKTAYKKLIADCNHHVFYDIIPFPTAEVERYCATCGIFRGQI